MLRSLLIAVRFHEGRYHGQEDGFDGANGWPPSPGRLFQALVAAAADGAVIPVEDEGALRWFEGLDPPRVAAPAARRGRAVKLYVPNNDLDSVDGDPSQVGRIRVLKQWRPCFFDPDQSVLYTWNFNTTPEQAIRICAMAAQLYQFGRGIDMAYASGRVLAPSEADAILAAHPGCIYQPKGAGETAIPHIGTLDSLIDRNRCKRRRLTTTRAGGKSRQLFAQPPRAIFHHTGYDMPPRCLRFEFRNPDGAFAPRPLASVASVITGLRDAAAVRLQASLPVKFRLFERLIVGRDAGPDDIARRIRLIPIPSVGTPYTDLSIRRILVQVPQDCPIRVDDLKWAFSGLELRDSQTGETWSGQLTSTDDARMAARFMGPSRAFTSVTPLALPVARRRIDPARVSDEAKGGAERASEQAHAATAVLQALRHAGVRVSPEDVRVQREPFQVRGEQAEAFAPGTRFPKGRLWHAAVTFAEPVAGPLLLGDGRFLGLGLMSPHEPISGVS